jgi:carboxypeptidase-like protein/TonB-dependent receptor-like protein
MKKSIIILGILLFFGISSVFSQTGIIRGFVYDKSNGEPMIFTSVYLEGTTYGIATDVNGYFNLSKVEPGNYSLLVSFVGYDTARMAVEVLPNRIQSKTIYMEESSIKLEEFTVSAERQEMKTDVYTSIVKITPKQLTKIPTIGSEPDLAQYLQVLPGVIFTGDQGGQLYIRGGSPIQNKVLLDGMIVYNPFHSIGLFSVFDADIIRNADIYTGGFGAEYGGRISSIMDITTRDGNKKRIAGKVSSSTFGSKLLIEGPLKKQDESGGGSSSFILSGKTSYLEQSSKLFYTYIDEDGLPFNFTDLYGKLSFNAGNGSKVNLFGFNFSDNVKYQQLSDLGWTSGGLGGNAIVVPAGSPVLIKANFAYSNYGIQIEEADQRPRKSDISGFNMGLNFIYFLGKDELDFGLEVLGFTTDFEYFNSVGKRLEQRENTSEFAMYGKYKATIGKLLFEPSLRFHYYAALSSPSLEPRLGLKYSITDWLRIKFAGGLYSQNLIAANSDRDVVNLFYGFLSGTQNLQEEFDGKEITHSLQKSRHAIGGLEIDLSNQLTLNVETYLKDFNQLTNINRNKIYDDSGDNYDKPDFLKKTFIIETGNAYGVDLLMKYDYKQVYLWFVYSLGFVNRSAENRSEAGEVIVEEYHPHYDRRHNVNLLATYTFGKNLNWEASARWNLGSGFPFTQTQGFYELITFEDGVNTDYVSENGDLGIIYAKLNEGRLPYYHRLDVTVKRTFYVGDNSTIKATFSITNVYDRQNIFYFDRIHYERVNQLPFMPSLGLTWSF